MGYIYRMAAENRVFYWYEIASRCKIYLTTLQRTLQQTSFFATIVRKLFAKAGIFLRIHQKFASHPIFDQW